MFTRHTASKKTPPRLPPKKKPQLKKTQKTQTTPDEDLTRLFLERLQLLPAHHKTQCYFLGFGDLNCCPKCLSSDRYQPSPLGTDRLAASGVQNTTALQRLSAHYYSLEISIPVRKAPSKGKLLKVSLEFEEPRSDVPGYRRGPGKSGSSDRNSAAEAPARAEPSSLFRAQREAPRCSPGAPRARIPRGLRALCGAEGPRAAPAPAPSYRRGPGTSVSPALPPAEPLAAQPGPEHSAARPGASSAGAAAGSPGGRRPLPVT